jgi:hypothetical protein
MTHLVPAGNVDDVEGQDTFRLHGVTVVEAAGEKITLVLLLLLRLFLSLPSFSINIRHSYRQIVLQELLQCLP